MSSIKVKLRSSTTGHEGAIYYQIIHERKVRQLSTEYMIMPDEWDDERSMVLIPKSLDRRVFILSLRDQIRQDIERLTKIIRKLEATKVTYTTDDIVSEFRRCADEYTLFNYMKNCIVNLKQNGRIRTSETYQSALNSFAKYRNGEDIMLDSITSGIMEAYESWHKQRGNSNNTISFYMRILRAVYNRAVDDEIIDDRNPFRRVYTGIDRTVKRALPLSYLKKIKALDLSYDLKLDYARDIFMLSFYLRGMSFIDMAYLKKKDLHNGHVVYRRRKTGQQLRIAWTPEMQSILDKYPKNPTQYLLPILTNPEAVDRYAYRNMCYNINRNLKKICKAAGVALDNNLTLYVARHSWASVAKANGVPIRVISEGLGHDSETTTQIYLASLETSAVDIANDLIISSL